MTKSYHAREGIPGPCGHSSAFARLVEFFELKEGFYATVYDCSKCKGRYMRSLNTAQLPEPLQDFLLENKAMGVQWLHFFQESGDSLFLR